MSHPNQSDTCQLSKMNSQKEMQSQILSDMLHVRIKGMPQMQSEPDQFGMFRQGKEYMTSKLTLQCPSDIFQVNRQCSLQ